MLIGPRWAWDSQTGVCKLMQTNYYIRTISYVIHIAYIHTYIYITRNLI